MSEARPKVYLLDVEGTVAPLSLTTEVLFPYARKRLEQFFRKAKNELEWARFGARPKTRENSLIWDVAELSMENAKETDPDAPRIAAPVVQGARPAQIAPEVFIPVLLEYAYWLMDRDRKSTALKSLQGKIWKAGFESGELKGTLFEDVPEAFRRWSAGARVAIYSSGSVEAQKLFFRYSSAGDLTPIISGYFDTRTGPKMESASYAAIAAAMDVAPADLLFFSDSVRELDAAREAGCETRLVMRDGNPPVEDPHGHSIVESFAGL